MRKLNETVQPTGPAGAFTFRRLSVEDFPRAMEIERDGFRHPWSEELLRKELTHDWSQILVATEQATDPEGRTSEVMLGFVVCWLVHDELHILNLAVAVEARRRGVARALLRESEARARQRGAALATLEVRRSNIAALKLYQSLGYRQVGIRANYYADEGEDAIVMVADL